MSTIKLTLRNYKHSDTSKPVDIFLYREHPVCPVSLLLTYLNLRDNFPGPLFCWPDASPISRSFFTSALTAALNFCNLDVSTYKSHSFRIGAASWAAAKGFSDAQIRRFGRWNSNAFLRYIRIPSLSTWLWNMLPCAHCSHRLEGLCRGLPFNNIGQGSNSKFLYPVLRWWERVVQGPTFLHCISSTVHCVRRLKFSKSQHWAIVHGPIDQWLT